MREILLLACLIATIPFVYKRPWLTIAIYIGANVIRPEMLFWGGYQGNYIFKVYYILIIIICLTKGYLHNARYAINRQFVLMLWLICAVGVSIALAQYETDGAGAYAVELLKALGICALIYMVCDSEDVQRIQNILLGCFTFLGIWGIQQSFLGNVRMEGLGGNSWADSNGVAAVFVLFFPLALAKLRVSATRREFWISLFVVAVMLTLVFLTRSRGGLLGLVASVVALGFYSRGMRKAFVTVSLMALLALAFAGQSYLDRMKTMERAADTETLDGSARSRLILWQAGLMVFSENPFFGTGFLTYPEAKMKYEDRFSETNNEFRKYVFRTKAKKVTHNTYVQVLSDCGLFGAVPFFLLVTGGIWFGFTARRLLIQLPEESAQIQWLCGLSAGITGFAVCILFIDALLQPFLFLQLTFADIMLNSICTKSDVTEMEDSVDLPLAGNQT